MIDEKDLELMNFCKSGVLRITIGSQLQFDRHGSSRNSAPGVYLWLRRKDVHRHDVMYAGKAGSGIATRMREHVGGLKRAHADRVERIKSAFGLGDCLEVWFRQSEKISLGAIFSEHISSYSTEEEALITRFTPQLNRAKTPAMRAESKRTGKPLEGNTLFTALNFELSSANGMQRNLWEDALTDLTESHKQKIGNVLALLGKSSALRAIWPTPDFKVVGFYTDGPLCNQPMLVFGEIAKTNFKQGSRVVYVSLEKELIAFSPEVTEKLPRPPDVEQAYSLDACHRMLTKK